MWELMSGFFVFFSFFAVLFCSFSLLVNMGPTVGRTRTFSCFVRFTVLFSRSIYVPLPAVGAVADTQHDILDVQ